MYWTFSTLKPAAVQSCMVVVHAKVAAIHCSPELTCPYLQVLFAEQTPAAACALHQIPIVGTVLSTSPICNLYKIVVLPAASRPNMTTCTSTEGSQKMSRMLRQNNCRMLRPPSRSYPHFPVAKQLIEHFTKRVPHCYAFGTIQLLAKLIKGWLLSLQCLHGFITIVLSGAAAQRAVFESSSDGSVLLYGAAQLSSRSLQLLR